MKKACLVVVSAYLNNRIFDLSDPFLNRDNCSVPFVMLKEALARFGYDLSTQDINSIEESNCVVYTEMPGQLPAGPAIARSFLLPFETELIVPANWDFSRHKNFAKIFTWNDDLVDGKKYFKMNWSYVLPEKVHSLPEEKKRFCCMIAGNKAVNHPLELYSHRIEAIRWFEKYQPEMFDLFGIGWNELRLPGSRFFEKYQVLKWIKKAVSLFAPQYPSYRGRVVSKSETLRNYRFAICYENARDIPGYITEKIFDCLFAGCIPVYWGADNITDHVPADCFIDKRKFSSYEELFFFLKNMTDAVFMQYIAAINRFLAGAPVQEFSAGVFAEGIADEILRDLPE